MPTLRTLILASLPLAFVASAARAQQSGIDPASQSSPPAFDDNAKCFLPPRHGIPMCHDVPMATDNGGSGATCSVSQSDLADESGLSDAATVNDTGDPVALHNGMVSVRRTDMFIPGRGLHFELTRRYNSKVSSFPTSPPNPTFAPSVLGCGWDHSYNLRLTLSGSTAQLWNGNNRLDTYFLSGGQWFPPAGVYSTFHQILDTNGSLVSYAIRGRHGDITRFFAFGSDVGKLESIEDPCGNKITFSYAGGKMTQVTDTLGRPIMFAYDATSGNLTEVTDFVGRKVVYSYNTSNELVAVRSPLIVSTAGFNDFPNGRTEQYQYNSTWHLLTGIKSPEDVRLNAVASLEFEYQLTPSSAAPWGATGVWCNRQRLGNDWIYYWYSTAQPLNGGVCKTLVTDRRGKQTTYYFDSAGHAKHIEESVGGSTISRSFTYNQDGEVTEAIYPEGNKSQRQFPPTFQTRTTARGNPLSVTIVPKPGSSLSPLTTGFVWEPVFEHICQITDPRGGVTKFLCDYMEGSPNALDANYNIPDIASAMLIDVATAGPLVSGALQDKDLNGDGQHQERVDGRLVQKQYPDALLPTIGGVAGQAGLEGGTTQEAVSTYVYNQYGQTTSTADAEENVSTYSYYPASDPDGDGANITPGQDGVTGGYLRQRVQDTTPFGRNVASDIGRDSALNPALTERRTDWKYDRVGNVTGKVDPRGIRTDSFYNEVNELWRRLLDVDTSAVAARAGGVNGSVETGVAALGYEQKWSYDANGNVTGEFYINTGGLPESEDGGAAKHCWEHAYAYDVLNRLTKRDDEVGLHGNPHASAQGFVSSAWTYDPNGNVSTVTSPAGTVTVYQYDDRDLVLQVTQAFGTPDAITTTYAYSTNGLKLTRTVGGIASTVWTYDGIDRVSKITGPVGTERCLTYDAGSNVTQVKLRGHAGGASPDNPDPLVNAASNSDLTLRDFFYDARNRVVQIDCSSPVAGQPLIDGALIPGDAKVSTRIDYDRLGRKTFVVEDDAKAKNYRYDGAGRTIRTEDALLNRVEAQFDDNSNLVRAIEVEKYPAGGTVTERQYETFSVFDAANRAMSVTDNAGQTYRYSYDSRGNAVKTTDAQGAITPPLTINGRSANQPGKARSYWYDGMNRLWREEQDVAPNVWNADGRVKILQDYRNDGLIESQKDDNGNATTWAYTAAGLPKTQGFADGTSKQYSYDAAGRFVGVTDGRGNVAAFTVDRAGRVIAATRTNLASSTYPGSKYQTFQYDGLGRQTKSTDSIDDISGNGDWTIDRTFDALSRILTETQDGKQIAYTWKEERKRARLAYPTGSSTVVDYVYDDVDRVIDIKVDNSTTPLASYAYAGPSRLLQRRTRNSVSGTALFTERFHDGAWNDADFYDDDRRPTKLEVKRGTVTVTGFAHGWDRANNRTDETRLHHDGNRGDRYTYDELSRLTTFERNGVLSPIPGGFETTKDYGIDGAENWRQLTTDGVPANNIVNSVNEYTAFAGQSPVHDADGNVTQPAGANGVTLSFDWVNRLRQISSSSGTVTHDYDAGGRRIRTTFSSGFSGSPPNTTYYHDGWTVIEERDGNGSAVLRRFVSGKNIDEPLRLENLTAAHGVTGTYFYQRNVLGSIAAITDSNGNVVERYTYDAYGQPRFEDSTNVPKVTTHSDFGNPYLFAAHRYDAWLFALYDYRSRVLDPFAGRFVQRDSIGIWTDRTGLGNGYQFCGGSPPNCTDPFGLTPIQLPSVSEADPIAEAEPPRLNDFVEVSINGGSTTTMSRYQVRDLVSGGFYKREPAYRPTGSSSTIVLTSAGSQSGGMTQPSQQSGPRFDYSPLVRSLTVGNQAPSSMLPGSPPQPPPPALNNSPVLLQPGSSTDATPEGLEPGSVKPLPPEAEGGVYVLVDSTTGEVVYVGRTNEADRREGEHLRDPVKGAYEFRLIYPTDDPAVQRGVEQTMYQQLNPPLNVINPVGPRNPNRPYYMFVAAQYLANCK